MSTAMLNNGQCAETVIFEFKEPIVVIERSGPLQERHRLEYKGHYFYQNGSTELNLRTRH